jgi:hypothetical protein
LWYWKEKGLLLVQNLEELGGGCLVKRAGELRDGRGGLQAIVEDRTLALQPDVSED